MTIVRINERTKTGKAILELLKIFSKEEKGIEIVSEIEIEQEKHIPNAETLRSMRNAKNGIDVKKFNSIDELFSELNS